MEKISDVKLVEKLVSARKSITEQLGKVIVGQQAVIDQLLISLFAKGHCLIVGVPGLAKTLLISTISEILNLQFSRIQFTPDLMPSDITGTEVIQENISTGERSFKFVKGPIFANIILADEINRTPPKTQSALLQSMQESKVTVAGQTHILPLPFFVLATQNPIEQEGTYPLPEAQLDRFFFQVNIDYPSNNEEKEIIMKTTGISEVKIKRLLDAEEILSLQEIVRKVPVSDYVVDYVVKLVSETRPKNSSLDFIKKWINWGAGPRASQNLILAGKSKAVLDGRFSVSSEDINSVLYPVLRHRLILNYTAEAEGITTEEIIKKLTETITPK
ncbi:MAG: AAA family ATPase [Elusimicrobia bacterium RIFOXYC2_FULL_34_12]|nr:MAG: AAA family ATPase [Elusimicrobia bacterium RIFOXYC2_FULL_34_12]OGS38812.1 MAG: AAA family ATPase [Elusimicrobia bacterium RIFOXYD2_FULL_34_30]